MGRIAVTVLCENTTLRCIARVRGRAQHVLGDGRRRGWAANQSEHTGTA
jgi:hypothetical protein